MFLKKIIIPIVVAVVIGLVVTIAIIEMKSPKYEIIEVDDTGFSTNQIMINDVLIDLQIADTELTRKYGLMGQENLASNEGMLFIYDKSDIYGFWMHNMKIGLDIIWFDNLGNIVHVEQNVPPCTTEPEDCKMYYPNSKGLYVLEVNEGFVEEYDIMNNQKFYWVLDKQ